VAKDKIEISEFRKVVNGKEYDKGNHIFTANRALLIEFDSDYYITKHFNGKNWLKSARKAVKDVPNPVTLDWLEKHGWEVPEEIKGG
jgi:hypothetical protein